MILYFRPAGLYCSMILSIPSSSVCRKSGIVDIEVWFYLTTILIVEVGALTVSNPMEVHRALFFSFEVEVWLLMFRVYDVDISLLKPIGST